jgi:hypothetical protein
MCLARHQRERKPSLLHGGLGRILIAERPQRLAGLLSELFVQTVRRDRADLVQVGESLLELGIRRGRKRPLMAQASIFGCAG